MTVHSPLKVPNILVVDDTPANLLLLERMLADRGYRPRPVSGGRLALQAARAELPDLILLDVSMPEMNGYEVCTQLKSDAALREVPVIFVSALNEPIDKLKAFSVGGVDYVTKPFHLEEVFARIRTHLELRRLEQLRQDLSHMIVHDLRNPLAVICGFLDILEIHEAPQLTPGTRKLVSVARRSAREMLQMIGSILDVSKLGAGEMKIQLKPCDLTALIRDVLASSRPLPGNLSVSFEAPESSVTVPADAGLIRRVLQNLLSNSFKYSPAGGDIRVVLTPSTGEVRVAVTDTGTGVAPEFHKRIFEKFGQVEDSTSRVGTGLGLTFCKLAVEAHDGRIGIESEVGKGSTFWLTLPLLDFTPETSCERNAQ